MTSAAILLVLLHCLTAVQSFMRQLKYGMRPVSWTLRAHENMPKWFQDAEAGKAFPTNAMMGLLEDDEMAALLDASLHPPEPVPEPLERTDIKAEPAPPADPVPAPVEAKPDIPYFVPPRADHEVSRMLANSPRIKQLLLDPKTQAIIQEVQASGPAALKKHLSDPGLCPTLTLMQCF